MCQPGRDRVMTTWAMIAMTTAERTAIEKPWTVPSPMKSQRSEDIIEDLDRRAVVDHEDVEDRAADDQRDERGQEGAQAHIADQIAVEAAEGEAGQHGGGEGDPDRLLQNEEAADRREVGEGEDRPDREIDAAAQHDDGQARHDDGKLAELARGIAQR